MALNVELPLIERELKQPVGGINKTSHYDRKY